MALHAWAMALGPQICKTPSVSAPLRAPGSLQPSKQWSPAAGRYGDGGLPPRAEPEQWSPIAHWGPSQDFVE